MAESSPTSLQTVLASIEPASAELAAKARTRLSAHGSVDDLGRLARVAERLAAARHSTLPPVQRRLLAVAAADHGASDDAQRAASDRGVRAVAAGRAPLNVIAREHRAQVVVIDAGLFGADLGPGVLELRVGDGTADFRHGPAMDSDVATLAVDTGVALAMSLVGDGLDLLGVSALGAGTERSAAVLAAALLGQPTDVMVVEALERNGLAIDEPAEPLAALAAVGGYELGVLAGACLGAAALRVPVLVDGGSASVAALLAGRLAPAVAGYLFAAHAGAAHHGREALAALDLEPLLDLGLAPGPSLAAALPVIDAAARLLKEIPTRSLPVV